MNCNSYVLTALPLQVVVVVVVVVVIVVVTVNYIKKLQKIAILGTARLLREVLM
jgi:hypothetical protein